MCPLRPRNVKTLLANYREMELALSSENQKMSSELQRSKVFAFSTSSSVSDAFIVG